MGGCSNCEGYLGRCSDCEGLGAAATVRPGALQRLEGLVQRL